MIKKIKQTTLKELKRFMGVVMYMATYVLSKPRNYWREGHEPVTKHFTANTFEQLHSSIHVNCTNSTEKSKEKSTKE